MSLGLILSLLGWPVRIAGSAIAAIWRWAAVDPLRLVLLAVTIGALVAAIAERSASRDRDTWKAKADAYQASATEWKTARDQLVADVTTQKVKAAAEDKANAARVAAQFVEIRERTADDYQARLDDTARALDRVRRDLASATADDRGDGGSADMPASLTTRCQALGAADCDALLAALPGQLAAAEDNTGKLISLQDYVRRSLAIDYSGAQPEAVEQ